MGSILLFATLTIKDKWEYMSRPQVFAYLFRKFIIYFCRWTRLTITQEAVLSPSESLANTSMSETVRYEIN
jgi:hypothetical protein